MFSHFIIRFFAFVSFAFLLTACVGSNNKELENKPFSSSLLTAQEGAAVAFRVTMDKSFCDYGTIKLRRVQNGIIDKSRVKILNATTKKYIFAGMSEDMKKPLSILYPLTFKSAAEKMTYADIKGAFSPIEPGDYILTEVRCERRDGYKAVVGETTFSFFLHNEIPKDPKPLLGSNFIHINAGEMVDLGVLNLKTINTRIFGKTEVMVVGITASGLLQNTIAQRFPDLKDKIRFTSMSFDPAVMRQYLENAM